ncbi:MAG TPA: hypothetical protein VGR81_00440 [Candidatus Acidoferrales bacterium]|nr:hypothetical protein [Candidatus Acidoferrales bacterium]
MKRIFDFVIPAALLFIFAASTARAQGSRHDGVVFGENGKPVSGATIVVCTQPANVTVTPCTPLANLYTDATLATASANPLSTDGLGNFHFYAAPGMYTVQIYGPGVNTYTMHDVLLPINPSNALFSSLTATNAISALTLSLGGNLSVGGNANVTGTLTAGSFNANLALTSNAALKPDPGYGVQYVDSVNGNDANDGKSPGTAVADIYTAWNNLPSSAGCSFTDCGGTIHLAQNAAFGGPVTGQGLEILGPNDPNFSSPPSGWLVMKNVSIVCDGAGNNGSSGQTPSCNVTGNDSNHPAIWISGQSRPMSFERIKAGGNIGVLLGKDSNGSFATLSGAADLTFKDDDFYVTGSSASNGPTMLIGPNSFEIYIHDSNFDSNISATGGTEQHQCMALDNEGTTDPPGLVYIYNSHCSDGGIEANGIVADGLKVDGFITEGQSDGKGAVWFTASSNGSLNDLRNISVADATAPTPAVENDGNAVITASGIFGGEPSGPSTVLNEYPETLAASTISPLQAGQSGFIGGWVFGKRDDAQRNFGLAPVRFANIAPTNPSSWILSQYSGTTTFTPSGFLAPDGSTNASQASNTSATGFETLSFYQQNHAIAVGDYIVAGAWVRSATANGYSGSSFTALQITVGGTGNALTGGCTGDPVLGDGEWSWQNCIYKVTAAATNPALLTFFAPFNATYTIQAYAPVMNYISAGTISPNEIAAYANALKTYDSTCLVATICGLRNDNLAAPAFQTLSANPAQSGALRLADGDAIAWRNHANTADVTLSKNTSDQLVAPPFASPTFFGPIIDSSSGASGITWRNSGSTVWTTNASSSALSFTFNAHLGETTMKLAPFGGQSYAGLVDNYGMTAGFVAVAESSGTASFDAGLGNTFEVTLNASATSSTLSNAQPGQWLHFIICQPSSGGPFTFAWPGSMRGAMTIGTTAGKCSAQSFVFDGTSAFATSPGVANQ